MRRNLVLVLLVACGGTTGESDDARRQFIDKASRALHPSAAPLTADQVDAMMDMSDEDIVAQLYAAPETRDAVFALSLDFVGAPIDELHQGGGWSPKPFVFAPAVSAARAFRDGTDPLAPLFTTKAAPATGVSHGPDPDVLSMLFGLTLTGTPKSQRAQIENYFTSDTRSLRQQINAMPEPFDQTAMCGLYEQTLTSVAYYYIPMVIGIPQSIYGAGYPNELAYPAGYPLYDACFQNLTITKADALATLDAFDANITGMFARLEPLFATWETQPEVAFDPVDFASIGFYAYADAPDFARNTQFYPTFWDDAQNSSTNFSRRRGAYVLDRFFCDDLKPVGAALPESHGDGKHASDPGCRSCHFKLDPMAGFFRRHGFSGTGTRRPPSSPATRHVRRQHVRELHDLPGRVERAHRQPSVTTSATSGRRATTRSTATATRSRISTGSCRAPREVERCFVQRVFEHFNGADQAVDPGFLDDVATDIHGRGADRLPHAISRILTGQTFRTPDRNSTVCYDLAPGADTAHRPPCEVASDPPRELHVVPRRPEPAVGPRSQHVEKGSDGQFGFRYVANGTAVSRTDTFMRMLDRVTTSDLSRQMPQGRDMELRSREQLALWLQQMVGNP